MDGEQSEDASFRWGSARGALRAARGARTPPDPVEELKKAWNDLVLSDDVTIPGSKVLNVTRIIVALEAARKVGK